MTAGRDQRGSMVIEFVLLVPMLMLLFGVVVGGARVWLARGAAEQAAAAAARAASMERSVAAAEQAGRDFAAAQANTSGLRCTRFSVQVDAGALGQDAGTAGRVQATVNCAVPLADVLVPGWPGTVDVSGNATAVVDRYRGRK